ncbi:hypothetical protein ACYSNR_01570 [Enterococcus sp. LJL128]
MAFFNQLFRKKADSAKKRPAASSEPKQLSINRQTLAPFNLLESELDSIFQQTYSSQHPQIHLITSEEFQALSMMTEVLPDVCFLWTDDESNYAGLFYQGPLRGKIMFLDHGNPFYVPLYKTVDSFIQRVADGSIENLYIPELGAQSSENKPVADFPMKADSSSEMQQNYACSKILLGQLSQSLNEDDYAQIAFQAFYLMPKEHLYELLPFLDNENMYILQELPYLFAFHNFLPARPLLEKAAEAGNNYIKSHAQNALKRYTA